MAMTLRAGSEAKSRAAQIWAVSRAPPSLSVARSALGLSLNPSPASPRPPLHHGPHKEVVQGRTWTRPPAPAAAGRINVGLGRGPGRRPPLSVPCLPPALPEGERRLPKLGPVSSACRRRLRVAVQQLTSSPLAAKAHTLVAQQTYDVAAQFLTRLLALDPSQREAREMLGVCELEQGNVEAAFEVRSPLALLVCCWLCRRERESGGGRAPRASCRCAPRLGVLRPP